MALENAATIDLTPQDLDDIERSVVQDLNEWVAKHPKANWTGTKQGGLEHCVEKSLLDLARPLVPEVCASTSLQKQKIFC